MRRAGYVDDMDDKLLWRGMDTAPRDCFVILWCPEDGSRWWAKWQGGEWYGCDELGLTRSGHTLGDPNYVTGWFIAGWRPIPDAPVQIEE